MEPGSARGARSGEAGRAGEAVAGSAAFPEVPTRFRLSEDGLLYGLLLRVRLASRGEDVLLALPFGLLVLTEVPFAEVLKRLLDSLL
jgi:hypothetical protein